MKPVEISFQVGGIRSVEKAFGSIADAAARAAKAQIRSAIESERATTRAGRAAEKSANQERRAVEAAEKAKVKATEKSEKDRERAFAKVAREADRYQREEVRGFERAEREKSKIAEREALARSRAVEREHRHAQRQRDAFARNTGGTVGRSVSGVLNRGASLATSGVGLALSVGGGFSIADSVGSYSRARGRAVDLENQSNGALKADATWRTASGVGTRYGVKTETVIGGLDAFVAKAGTKDAKALTDGGGLNQLVELAAATGADLEELSRTAGIVHMSSTGKDSAERMSNTLDMMRTIAGMGREGSVDMRELSQYAGRLTAGAAVFSDKTGAAKQLSAMVQQSAATGGSAGAAEATESISHLGSDVFKHREAFEALGIKTTDATGKFLRDPAEIIKQSLSKTAGDQTKLHDLYGERSFRAVAGYADLYNRSATATNGSAKDKDAAGLAAVDAAIASFAKAAITREQQKSDAAKRVAEADRQLESILNDVKDSLGSQLLPELAKMLPEIKDKLVPALKGAAPEIVKAMTAIATTLRDHGDDIGRGIRNVAAFVGWFAENPIKGVGAVVLAAIVKDITAAMIGSAIKRAIENAISSGRGGGGGGGGAGAGGGKAGDVMNGVGAALAAGYATKEAYAPGVDGMLHGQVEGQAQAGAIARDLARGTDDERAAALKRVDDANKATGARGAVKLLSDVMLLPAASAYSAVSGEKNFAADGIRQYTAAQQITGNDEVKALTAAIRENTTATRESTTSGGPHITDPNSGNRNGPPQPTPRGR